MLGIPNFWGERYDPEDLPTWRKVIAIASALGAIVTFLFVGSLAVPEELYIYRDAPSSPVPTTKQIYPIYVEHGHLRYITRQEVLKLALFAHASDAAGLLLVISALTMLTFRRPTSHSARKDPSSAGSNSQSRNQSPV